MPEERDARYHTYMHTRTELVLAICLDWLGSAESMTEIEGLLFVYLLLLEKIVNTTNSLPCTIYCRDLGYISIWQYIDSVVKYRIMILCSKSIGVLKGL